MISYCFVPISSQKGVLFLRHRYLTTGRPKLIVPCLLGYCRRTVNLIISVFAQLHRSGFNVEFETLCESI